MNDANKKLREALAEAEREVLNKHGMLNNMPNESAELTVAKAERYREQQTVYGQIAMPMLDDLAQAMTQIVHTQIKSGRVSALYSEWNKKTLYYD